jgi:hypothetical protein
MKVPHLMHSTKWHRLALKVDGQLLDFDGPSLRIEPRSAVESNAA